MPAESVARERQHEAVLPRAHPTHQPLQRLVRRPFELALAQVDAMADHCENLIKRDSALEVARVIETAAMRKSARAVLSWRMAGVTGEEMARWLRRSTPVVQGLLREARSSIRDQMQRIRTAVML